MDEIDALRSLPSFVLLCHKVRKLNSSETKESYFIIEKIFQNSEN
jgi:hypothetical protein